MRGSLAWELLTTPVAPARHMLLKSNDTSASPHPLVILPGNWVLSTFLPQLHGFPSCTTKVVAGTSYGITRGPPLVSGLNPRNLREQDAADLATQEQSAKAETIFSCHRSVDPHLQSHWKAVNSFTEFSFHEGRARDPYINFQPVRKDCGVCRIAR